ncbi:hypothetical protein COO60DRAFT_1477717 [Scenedesmus sp. NREL 46B-D3]|nr:hypothetical protein COO60DRAFT_1477717 [Scenedesmus sp. NREL 46B-D3]
MKLSLAWMALVALVAAAHAQEELAAIDNTCQFASFNPSVVPLSADTHRTTALDSTAPVKFLFNNQQCTDFVLCVSDSSLSGGDGCAIRGAASSATHTCSLKGTARGDGTYMLSLNEPKCQGLDLVNCLSVNADGTAMEITHTCQAKIESLTISCAACGAPSGAVAKALQNDCECEDKTSVTKDDQTRCTVQDGTTCSADDEVVCTPEGEVTGETDVECPRFRARSELVFERQIPTGAWVRVNAPGSTEFTTPVEVQKCPEPVIEFGDGRRVGDQASTAQQGGGGAVVRVTCAKSGSCTPRKSGTCAATKAGFCACTKSGGCVPKAGPFSGKVEVCPQNGGTVFAPCNGDKHEPFYPPYKPSHPSKGGAHPPKGGIYTPKGPGKQPKHP